MAGANARPGRGRGRSRAARPALFGLALFVFALAVGTWRQLTEDFSGRFSGMQQTEGATHWVAPGVVPFTVEGDLERAQTLVLGDSRVWRGIVLDQLERSGAGPVAVVWHGGADVRVLLRHIGTLDATGQAEPRRLVVALSARSVAAKTNLLMLEIARQRAPVFDAWNATDRDVVRWAKSERAHLVEAGFPVELVDAALSALGTAHRTEREDLHGTSRSIDRRLGAWLLDARKERVFTFNTAFWTDGWFRTPRPDASNRVYQAMLRPRLAARRAEAREEVVRLLREAARSRPVACVRLPVSPELRRVEDSAVPSGWLEGIAAEAGVPYLHGGSSNASSDGSHLLPPAARTFSAQLGGWLEQLEGW